MSAIGKADNENIEYEMSISTLNLARWTKKTFLPD